VSSGDILVVDDSPHDLDLASSILSARGFDVRVAASGRRGLAAAKAAPPDLILLDVNLPDTNGYDVCTSLKADPATRTVPVIFISGLDSALDKVRAFDAGAVDYVTKPFEAGELGARIDNQLRVSRLQRELERQNSELLRSREEALAASRAKSVFLANMSHELRTPLNGILGFVQLMERDPDLSDVQRENLEVITRSGEQLLGLINDVLAAAKIESGQVTVVATAFDVRRALRGLEELFRLRAHEKNLQFVFEVRDRLPQYVSGDQGKVRQVLACLLGNAIKFTQDGGVALRADWDCGTSVFEVEDTGEGIAPDEVEHIFEAFVQASAGKRAREGTGLGLAISRDYVELMGGTIDLKSEVGRGTVFRVALPLPAAEKPDEDGERAGVTPTAPLRALGRDDARARLSALPPLVLGGLRKAVTLGDLEAAGDLVEAVALADGVLADELRRLVRGYQLDRLFDLVEGL
jgi:signal transduction histidine kinase